MLPEKTISFLQEKINDIRSAIVTSLSNSVVKLPSNIVNILKVDDAGQLWFFLNAPDYVNALDKEFPVQLNFYRKGKPFYFNVSGKAWIVDDPEYLYTLEDMLPLLDEFARKDILLIKVQALKVDYFENVPKPSNWYNQLVVNMERWIFNTEPGHKSYSLVA